MASNSPRILTIRFVQTDTESKVVWQFGVRELEKPIPKNHGVIRACAIMDENGQLGDVELVTEKL